MIAKLMPLPAMMVNRNPVAMLRWPTRIWVIPNVQATPTAMVSTMAMSVRKRR
jgi:hypothetical protein